MKTAKMGPRERKAFLREVYGSGSLPPKRSKERSDRAAAARKLAQSLNLPQRIIDRAASYAADSASPESACQKALSADKEVENGQRK